MWSYMAAPMCTHTLVFCVVYPQQDYSPPPEKILRTVLMLGYEWQQLPPVFPANPVVVSLLFIQFLLTYPAPQSTLSVHLQHFTAFITLILVVLMPEHNCKLQQD